jgi:hypothetical protein
MDILAKSIIIVIIVIAIVVILLEFIWVTLAITVTIIVAITLGIATIRSESNICAEHIVNSINGKHIEHLAT